MTNEQLKEAIVIEATRRWKERGLHFIETLANIAVELTQEGWTPPVAVDPDLAEAQEVWKLWSYDEDNIAIDLALAGIKRGRERERAVQQIPIAEQTQTVVPPAPVDPDLIEAREIVAWLYAVSWPERANAIRAGKQDHNVENVSALSAIKRGRALAAAEAKPVMVWVKHDGSTICPVDRDIWVLTKTFGYNPCVNRGKRLAWQSVSFYCVITPPAEDVA